MISLDLMKSSEIRKAGDRSICIADVKYADRILYILKIILLFRHTGTAGFVVDFIRFFFLGFSPFILIIFVLCLLFSSYQQSLSYNETSSSNGPISKTSQRLLF